MPTYIDSYSINFKNINLNIIIMHIESIKYNNIDNYGLDEYILTNNYLFIVVRIKTIHSIPQLKIFMKNLQGISHRNLET